MKLVSALLGFGWMLALFGEEGVPVPERETPPVDFRQTFQREFHDLFEMLGREYPAFLRELKPEDADKALLSVLKALHSGVEPESAERKESGAKKQDLPENPPAIRLKNGAWYFRIHTLNAAAFGELLRSAEEAKRSPGLILDLRSCAAGDWNSRPEEIGKLFSPSALHTVVLLGPETCGAAEILASKLFASHRGIGIGAPTKGRPYSRRAVTLSSRRWLVPQPPAGAEEVRYEPCVPQIRVSPLPRTRVEDLKRHGDPSHSGDPALIRASDLLISLDLLEQKGLKK